MRYPSTSTLIKLAFLAWLAAMVLQSIAGILGLTFEPVARTLRWH